MPKTTLGTILIILWAAAVAAQAVYYFDERFNGPELPVNWITHNENGGYWDWHSSGGSPGAYITGFTIGGGEENSPTAVACIETPPFTIPQGNTLYYRYFYTFNVGAYHSNISNAFYIYYTDNSQRLVELLDVPNYSSWHLLAGSAVVSRAAPLRAAWRATGRGAMGRAGGCAYSVDTVQITDMALTAATPASLGRVKALYR